VFYGDYGNGSDHPANSVTAEQVNNIKTLTLSDNITLSGSTDQYDVIYDAGLTLAPGVSQMTHEIEVYLHTPSYTQGWIQNSPQHSFTDSQGMQWTIATSGDQVMFAPSDFHDLTNYTIDLKGLLQAAAAYGVISGNEYFEGIGLGVEAQQGSGSIKINSFSANYDGDPNFTGATGGTQAASAPLVTDSLAIHDTASITRQDALLYEHIWR